MAKIQKILSLGPKDWLTGITTTPHLDNKGLFVSAKGINPYVNHANSTSGGNIGLLQTSGSPVEIDGVNQAINAGIIRPTSDNAGKIYLMGAVGAFYSKNLDDDNSFTDLRDGNAITNPANSMVIYKAGSGTEYLYYFQATQIGRWDMSGTYPTGWTDNHFTGLTSTTVHNVHPFAGDVYYCNQTTIGKIYDNANTAANNTNVLDLPGNFRAVGLEDDSDYLVIAAKKNTALGEYSDINKVYFWDTFSPSWNREYTIYDPQIVGLKRLLNTVYAIGTKGLYALDFSNGPRKVLSLNNGLNSGTAGFAGGNLMVDTMGEAIIWNTTSPHFGVFGKVLPGVPAAYFQLFAGNQATAGSQWFNVSARDDRFYFQGLNADIYYIDTTTGGATSLSGTTIYFDLKDQYTIKQIDVILGEPLSSGDSLNIDVKVDEDTTATDWGTVSFSAHGAVKRASLSVPTVITTDQFALVLNFNGGNVKIKRINVYGEPIASI